MALGLSARARHRFTLWLFEGVRHQGPYAKQPQHAHAAPWWKVMCLTGVDYFSTLGYQPGIAFLGAGLLSPIATLILILLTLLGALPIYRRVAEESPHGQGSISMLEELLPRWRGKAFVLCLLGFAATDFVITITLSAADATAHILENPFVPSILHHPIVVTLALLLALGAVFLKGFREAIGVAVAIVASYLLLNVVVLAAAFVDLFQHPGALGSWRSALAAEHGSSVAMVGVALLLFPKLALGLSGFETGVMVMPLVRGDDSGDGQTELSRRIRSTKKMLATLALMMSGFLLASSLTTALLIPAEAFQQGGEAYGRAIAYLAHKLFGDVFGTIYDISTITILWFAGASAMAGLLNLVPRYLPRYGMAPEWAKATRPLVLIFTAITILVTAIFDANVDAQGAAYATGVLVLMSSAAVAVTLEARRQRSHVWPYLLITLVFVYTTVVNIFERPDGVKIAAWFIVTIVVTSLVSRVLRSTELRIVGIDADPTALKLIREASGGPVRIIANRPDSGLPEEYAGKLREMRDAHHMPMDQPALFLEVRTTDASDFSDVLQVRGHTIGGYRVLRCESPAIPNAIAALLLYVRDQTRQIPHAYFGWTEGNPIAYLLKFLAFGEGDTAPVTREVLRQAEPNPARRPRIHVG
jgi:hypothetical protein